MSTRKVSLCALFVAAGALWTTAAHAVVTTTYNGSTVCLPQSFAENSSITRTGGFIKNISNGPLTVYCPIPKKTSGPGITNDFWTRTDITMLNPNGLNLSCFVTFWRAQIVDYITPNMIVRFEGGTNDSSNTVVPNLGNPGNFWDGAGPNNWTYGTLECQLEPGTGVGNYTVEEQGTTQPGRIYPAFSCNSDPTNTWHWQLRGYLNAGQYDDAGGYFYSQADSDGSKLAIACPNPANTSLNLNNTNIQMALVSDILPNTLGCNLDSTNTSTLTWPASTSPQGPAILPMSGKSPAQPFIMMPPSGTHKIVCGHKTTSGNGDGAITSFRTIPWVASASNSQSGSPPSQAFDSNTGTRWTTGTAQAVNMTFTIDLGSQRTFNKIVMDSTGSNNDFARGYQVFVSNDGTNFGSAIASGTGTSAVVTSSFSAKTNRFIRVKLTSVDNRFWWSIHEFKVSN